MSGSGWRIVRAGERQYGKVSGHNSDHMILIDRETSRHLRVKLAATPKMMSRGAGHTHAETEHVIYVLSGEGEVRVGDEAVVMRPGDTLFIGPGVRHGAYNPHDTPFVALMIDCPPEE